MKNFRVDLRYSTSMLAFKVYITAEHSEPGVRWQWVGERGDLAGELPKPPLWKVLNPAVAREPSFYIKTSELFEAHRELNYYGPHKDEPKPPDMEQIGWLRTLIEKQLFGKEQEKGDSNANKP